MSPNVHPTWTCVSVSVTMAAALLPPQVPTRRSPSASSGSNPRHVMAPVKARAASSGGRRMRESLSCKPTGPRFVSPLSVGGGNKSRAAVVIIRSRIHQPNASMTNLRLQGPPGRTQASSTTTLDVRTLEAQLATAHARINTLRSSLKGAPEAQWSSITNEIDLAINEASSLNRSLERAREAQINAQVAQTTPRPGTQGAGAPFV